MIKHKWENLGRNKGFGCREWKCVQCNLSLDSEVRPKIIEGKLQIEQCLHGKIVLDVALHCMKQ